MVASSAPPFLLPPYCEPVKFNIIPWIQETSFKGLIDDIGVAFRAEIGAGVRRYFWREKASSKPGVRVRGSGEGE